MDVGSINFSGLASGLDTKAMIDAIMKAERLPLQRLQTRQSQLTQKRAALDDMQSRLASFQTALSGLSAETTFRARTATVSESETLGATVGAGAATGLYSIEVLALAAAHKVKSNSYAAPDQGLVADGTLTLTAGSDDTITVEVSAAAGNNSLDAIRDAINAADKGVRAAVLNDGSGYRLVLTSEESGTTHALALDAGTTGLGLSAPENAVTAATNAHLLIDGLDITSQTNQITGVIEGVTLNLRKETTVPVTVDVAEDHSGVVTGVQSLVSSYNLVMDFFNAQFSRDNPGVLSGDSTARSVQAQVMSLMTSGVEGIADGQIRSLSSVGVSFDGKTGKATLDTNALENMMETRFDEVGRMFVASGTATSTSIRYFSASLSTAAGTYSVQVTRAAEQAAVVGAQLLGATLGRDESLTLSVGASSVSVALTSAMSQAQVVDAINTALRGSSVSAAASLDSAGRLRIATREFGSGTSLSVGSNQADAGAGTGFGTTASTDAGVDIEGTFNGVAGSATGNGQILTGAEGGGYFGLALRVTATPAQVAGSTEFGTIAYSAGLVRSLSGALSNLTSSATGSISLARETMTETLKSFADNIASMETRLTTRQTRLIRQFSEAEKAISALQSQQAQLNSALR